MQNRNPLKHRLPDILFGLVAVLIVIADQLAKDWIKAHVALGETIWQSGIFYITRVQNTGAVWGSFRGNSTRFAVAACITAVVLIVYVLKFSNRIPFLDNLRGKIILGVILGGTVGNLVDRIRVGYVTDFIGMGWWPTYNIADSAMSIGVTLLILILIRELILESKHSSAEH